MLKRVSCGLKSPPHWNGTYLLQKLQCTHTHTHLATSAPWPVAASVIQLAPREELNSQHLGQHSLKGLQGKCMFVRACVCVRPSHFPVSCCDRHVSEKKCFIQLDHCVVLSIRLLPAVKWHLDVHIQDMSKGLLLYHIICSSLIDWLIDRLIQLSNYYVKKLIPCSNLSWIYSWCKGLTAVQSQIQLRFLFIVFIAQPQHKMHRTWLDCIMLYNCHCG